MATSRTSRKFSKSKENKSTFLWDYFWIDPIIHDKQHWWATLAGGIAGLSIFLTYYFFSRIEKSHKQEASDQQQLLQPPWEMPWWYFVVGMLLCACTGMALACTLSIAVRSR